MATTSAAAPQGWVLHDGDCGFCGLLARLWAGTLRRRGFEVEALQANWVREWFGLPEDELVADIRLLLADGGDLRGADVYRYLMRRIWWARPLRFASTLPLLSATFDLAYRWLADNRYRLSRSCRLPAKAAVSPHV